MTTRTIRDALRGRSGAEVGGVNVWGGGDGPAAALAANEVREPFRTSAGFSGCGAPAGGEGDGDGSADVPEAFLLGAVSRLPLDEVSRLPVMTGASGAPVTGVAVAAALEVDTR